MKLPFNVKLRVTKSEFIGSVTAGEEYYKQGALTSEGEGTVVEIIGKDSWLLSDNTYKKHGVGGGCIYKEEQHLFENYEEKQHEV